MSWMTLPWWLAGILLVTGLALLKTGLWPRRRGKTPHCPACNYNLTGLAGNQCPECGTCIVFSTTVFGERHRRPTRTAAGAVLLCLSGTTAIAAISIDWYSLAPTTLLVFQVCSDDVVTTEGAWRVLNGRITAGGVSAGAQAKLIDVALKKQAAAKGCPLPETMVRYLADCYVKGLLSQTQQTQFLNRLIMVELKVRPTVVMGDPVPYQVVHQMPFGSCVGSMLSLDGNVTLDGRDLLGREDFTSGGVTRNHTEMLAPSEYKTVGTHTLIVKPEQTIQYWDDNKKQIATGAKRRLELKAEFEVVAQEPLDHIRAIKDPSQRPALLASIASRWLRWSEAGTQTGYELNGYVEFNAVPTDIAFDVCADIAGIEYPMGSVHLTRGSSTLWWLKPPDGMFISTASPTINIVLRSNPRVARESVDLFNFWEGELVLKDVPVEKAPATAPAE